MAITISGTDGIVGAGFTVDNSGVSVTAGVGTFSSVRGTHHGDGANLTSIPAANIVGVCTSGLTKTGGFGKLFQVLQTVKTDTYTTSSTSYGLITGLTQAITATSTSNRILINITLYGGNNTNEAAVGFQLAKDGSVISGTIGDASGANQESGTIRFSQTNSNHAEDASFMFLDTPADTSAHTYGVLMKVFNSS